MRFSVPWSHGAQSRARSDGRQRSQQRILCSLPVHLMAYSGAYLSGCRTAQRESPRKGSGSTRNLPSTSSLPRTLTQLLAARAEMLLFFPPELGPPQQKETIRGEGAGLALSCLISNGRLPGGCSGANLQRPPVLPQVPYGRPSPIPLAGPNQRLRSGPGPRVPGPPLALPQGMPCPPPAANSRLTFKTPM
ncbi:unnamed protein product [Arctogadus glacialis]